MAALLLVLAACGDDSGSSASTGGTGTSVASSGGSGDTSGGASGSSDSGSGGGSNTTGAVTTEATTTTKPNPTVPDAQTNTSLVQTAVQMKFLAAALDAGQATPDAYQKVFAAWDVYDGTIQKKNPQAWQMLTDALTAMQNAVTAKDVAAANAAASAFEAASNTYLGSG